MSRPKGYSFGDKQKLIDDLQRKLKDTGHPTLGDPQFITMRDLALLIDVVRDLEHTQLEFDRPLNLGSVAAAFMGRKAQQ